MIALLRRMRRLLWVAGMAALALPAGESPTGALAAPASPALVA
jgi:hypothetical protein